MVLVVSQCRRDKGSIPVLGISLGGGNGNLLQYSCLENSMGRRAWWATFQGVAKQLDTTEHIHAYENHLTNTKNIYLVETFFNQKRMGYSGN